MKLFQIIPAMLLMLSTGVVIPALGQKAVDIMEKVYALPEGDSRKQTMTITKVNKRNRTREEKILIYSKDFPGVRKNFMYTLEPADVRGVRFLSWEYDDDAKDDDRWLYMPAMKRIRRITSNASKNEYFFGTDFTYNDLSRLKLEDDKHKFIKEDTYNGIKCWVIESVPNDPKIMYSKRINWINQENYFPVKVEYYDRMDNHLKTLNNNDIVNIDGIWASNRMEMENHQTQHKTILLIEDSYYNIDMNDYLFTVPALEEGRVE